MQLQRLHIGNDKGGVIDRREPFEVDAEDDDEHQAGEKCRHRKAHHHQESADLVKDRILLVGGEYAHGHGDNHAEDVRRADHPQCLRQALGDDVDYGTARRPGDDAHTIFGAGEGNAEGSFDEIKRLGDEELLQPFDIFDEEGVVRAQGFADFLPHFWRDGQGQVAGGVAGGEVDDGEDDEADNKYGWYGGQEPSD